MDNGNNKYELLDVLIKGATLILAIVIFSKGADALKEQYKSKFWDHQLSVYSEILNSTARMSTSEFNSLDFTKAKEDFLTIYYGEANLVSTRKVEFVTVRIKNNLDSLLLNPRLANYYQNEIRNLSIDLARECRNSALNSWDIEIDHLKK